MTQPIARMGGIIAITVLLSACGSKAPKPVSELALTGSALQGAENFGAREYAPIELRIAREKKEAADAAMANEEYAKARKLTEQALVDAELAQAKAAAEKSRLALREAQDNIEMIKTEAHRTSISK